MSGETSRVLQEVGAAVSAANTGRAPAPMRALYRSWQQGCSHHGEIPVSGLSVGIETLWSCQSIPTAFWTESSQFPHVTVRCWL